MWRQNCAPLHIVLCHAIKVKGEAGHLNLKVGAENSMKLNAMMLEVTREHNVPGSGGIGTAGGEPSMKSSKY